MSMDLAPDDRKSHCQVPSLLTSWAAVSTIILHQPWLKIFYAGLLD